MYRYMVLGTYGTKFVMKSNLKGVWWSVMLLLSLKAIVGENPSLTIREASSFIPGILEADTGQHSQRRDLQSLPESLDRKSRPHIRSGSCTNT